MTPTGLTPSGRARVAATLFLITLVGGIIAQGAISERMIVMNDAGETAANILANKTLFRLGFLVYMIEMAAQIGMTVVYYGLLRPAGPTIARLALVFGLTGCIVKVVARFFYYAPLLVLGNSAFASFDTAQLQSLSLVLLRVNDHGAGVALLFFGFETFMEGWLILRSTFLPRFLGVFAVISGLGWLTYLWRPLADQLFLYIALFALIGSILKIGWFYIKGVDEKRWFAQNAASLTVNASALGESA